MKQTCYLAGPMRGIPYFNFPAFDEAAAELRRRGWDVFSPAEKDRDSLDVSLCPDGSAEEMEAQGFSMGAALEWDFRTIMDSDAVVVLPGWKRSTGVHWELTVAYATGKPIYELVTGGAIELVELTELPAFITSPISHRTTSPSGEVRVVDPVTGGAKSCKLARFDLIPYDVLWELATHYGKGCEKYEDRNWERGYSWGLSIAALMRHLVQWLGGEDTDEETGSSHLVAVIWHAMALRWFQLHDRGSDDRSVNMLDLT